MVNIKFDTDKNMDITYPIIQAPPVMKATTGFGPSLFLGKNKSSLQRKYTINQNYSTYNYECRVKI